MKAAIYARYSSEHQNEDSIEGQNRKCEEVAAKEKWKIVARYADRAISGTKRDRPDYQRMLTAAEAREFDVLLVDSQARLGRDSMEAESAFRRLEHWGLRVICLDGYDSNSPKSARKMQRAMKGIINEAFLDQLAADTHRGMREKIDDNYSSGGRAYGYTSVPVEDASRRDRYGRPEIAGYRRKVVKEKAAVVVDIFAMYADGMNPKAIAAELNRREIPSPAADWNRKERDKRADGKWMGSAIYSMLDNEIYVGLIVWNKGQWEKDPETGYRVCRMRPESEWIRKKDESLRILSDQLWRKVKARQAKVAKDNAGLRESLRVLRNGNPAGRQPTNFWSGLLVCGKCGRNFIKISQYHYGCGSYANGGEHACGNTHRALASVLDGSILQAIKASVLTPERMKLMERTMREYFEGQLEKLNDASAAERNAARLSAIDGELANVTNAIAKVGINEALNGKLDELSAEKKQLLAETRTTKADPRLAYDLAAALPRLMAHNVKVIEELGTNKKGAARDPRLIARAQQAMRRLVGSITLQPTKKGLVAHLEQTGERIELVLLDGARSLRIGSQQNQQAIKMVAGVGFEPTTFGL